MPDSSVLIAAAILFAYLIFKILSKNHTIASKERQIADLHKEVRGYINNEIALKKEFEEYQKNTIEAARFIQSEKEKVKAETARFQLLRTNFENHYGDNAWFARVYADYVCASDDALIRFLRTKTPPAMRAAEHVAEVKREKHKWVQRAKTAEYQLAEIYADHPELEYSEVPDEVSQDQQDTNRDPVLNWLSEEEYATLSRIEKFQLAVDRYQTRHKSKWEIGIDYERYVGYLFFTQGYEVVQFGAIKGFEDLGRDLLCRKGKETIIVQCKRWAANKEIRENAVCQLHGTVTAYHHNHPKEDVSGLLVSTAPLSDTAVEFTQLLKISYMEQFEALPFPLVKCNIGQTSKEKIYHLPFDQQYDRVIISPGTDECYAWTVKEAEEKGFRRAYRWHSQNQSQKAGDAYAN